MFRTVSLVALLCLTTIAHGHVIRLQYSAEIERMFFADCTTFVNDSCEHWDNTDILSSDFFENNRINVSDQVTGSFFYNTTFDYNLSDDGHQAIYTDAISDYTINLGGTTLPNGILARSTIGDSLSIVNDRDIGNSLFDSFFASTWFSQDDWFASSNVSLSNRFGSLHDSFDIPTNFSLDDFTSATFRVGFVYRPTGDQLQISGNVTDLSLSQVSQIPAPSIFSLILLASILIIRVRHKS